MVVCAAVGCSNKPDRKIPGVTFHRRHQWTLAVKRANWVPSNNSMLCSRHFEPEMFDWQKMAKKGRQRFLKASAVPTIFDKEMFAVNQELLPPPKTNATPQLTLPVKQEPLDDILNISEIAELISKAENNSLFVAPDQINTNTTNPISKNNLVIVSDCIYSQNILNSEVLEDNRTLLVSDGTNVKTEWATYNESEESILDRNIYNHDPLILHSDDFILGRVRDLEGVVNNYKKKIKVLGQTSRRNNARIESLRKELYKINKKYQKRMSCTSTPVVHIFK